MTIARRVTALAAAGAVLSVAVAAAVAQGLPRQAVLPAALATEAVAAAVEACAREGWRVTVAVVDQGGVTRALVRGDGAAPHTVDSAFKKAYTAASLRRGTLELSGYLAGAPAAQGIRDTNPNILVLGGGLPIRAGEEVVGGIGVAGAPGMDKDEACANAAIAKIQDRLT